HSNYLGVDWGKLHPCQIVATKSCSFFQLTTLLGLPSPLKRLPYNFEQPGQTNDPLGWQTDSPLPVQGFGPSGFSYSESGFSLSGEQLYYPSRAPIRGLYDLTFGFHSGVDYGGRSWVQRVVISLCDGIVINGNNITGTPGLGGSAQPGYGVSVRCFMDALNSPFVDSDHDAQHLPNLSNIVVTYNHLLSGAQYVQLPALGSIVHAGDAIGQTGGDSFDHLHLSVHFARGFNRESLGEPGDKNTFYLNPMLMYSAETAALHNFQDYFPTVIQDGQTSTATFSRGIHANDLSSWSVGGFNSWPWGDTRRAYYGGTHSENSFWLVQNPVPDGPNQVEWSHDAYPSVPAADLLTVTELPEYLRQSYAPSPFQSVNCRIDVTPIRCIYMGSEYDAVSLPDLDDESPYAPIPHPGN
ncbi:MAG: hypothetical protein L6Q98_25195, partial [Anaerolineae bacterium]|nr:hypothetical protein [Anaerolineae bacterium]